MRGGMKASHKVSPIVTKLSIRGIKFDNSLVFNHSLVSKCLKYKTKHDKLFDHENT